MRHQAMQIWKIRRYVGDMAQAAYFLQKRGTVTQMTSLCSPRQDASTDMYFDLFWPNLTLRSRDLRSNLGLDISGSKYMYFMRLDERNTIVFEFIL